MTDRSLSDLSSESGQYFGLMDSKGVRRPSYDAAKTAFARARV